MKQKELIDYYVIDTSLGDNFEESDEFHEAVEIRGDDLMKIAKAFLYWHGRVQEVIYRNNENSKGFVVFSMLDNSNFFRSDDIFGPIQWSDERMADFLESQKKDKQKVRQITLDKIMKERQIDIEEDGFILEYMSLIYNISPNKDKIELAGKIYPFLFLMTLDWFVGKSKEIFYEKIRLV